MKTITIPDPALVILCGAPGSGKSCWAVRNFQGHQIVSSDFCRLLVSSTEHYEARTNEATFDVYHAIIAARMKHGLLTVADATHLKGGAAVTGQLVRARMLAMARQHRIFAMLVGFATPQEVCIVRDTERRRRVEGSIISTYARLFAEQAVSFGNEGFDQVVMLYPEEQAESRVALRSRSIADTAALVQP